MPAFTEPPEAGRVSGAVLLHLLAAPFDLSLPWGVLGGLPSCHVVTSTSGTELDLHELFHTSTNPPPPYSLPKQLVPRHFVPSNIDLEGKTQAI